MESKTKHRILGVLVLAGLIVILLPFFQRGKDISSETAMIQPPAFPDQSVQINADTPEPAKTVAQAPTSTDENDEDANKSLPIIQKSADEIVRDRPDDTIDTTRLSPELTAPSIDNNAETPAAAAPTKLGKTTPEQAPPATEQSTTLTNEIEKVAATTETQTVETAQAIQTTEAVKSKHASQKHAKKATKKTVVASAKRKLARRTSYVHLPIDNNGLANINSSVWVIQVGSFQNKANALRVVNRLRANGYRAFIQQVSTSSGKSTRVFVGPENKQASARALASELEKHHKLQGIVISYQPLAS